MLKEIILGKLEESKFPIKSTGKNFIITSCLNPNHNDKHPSFSVNLETGYGVCFSCGYKVNKKYWLYGLEDEEEIDLIMRSALYANLEKYYESPENKERTVLFPPKSDKEIESPWRGLTKETLQAQGIYYCDYGHFEDRVIFPMRDNSGQLVAFNSRALHEPKEDMQKYKYSKGIPVNTLLYPSVPHGTKELVLCEGIMDALSMVQDGIPAVFNFGINYTFSSEKIATLLKIGVETIYIAFDNDEAGLRGMTNYLDSNLSDYFNVKPGKLCRALVPFYMSDCKDYNEFILNS